MEMFTFNLRSNQTCRLLPPDTRMVHQHFVMDYRDGGNTPVAMQCSGSDCPVCKAIRVNGWVARSKVIFAIMKAACTGIINMARHGKI